MERDFKGIWIPKEIWLNEELTLMEKVFFVEIDSLDNEEGCTASNNYFAKFFHITAQRASQVINNLIHKKYITANYEYNGLEIKKRVLNIFDRGIKFSKLGIKFSLKGYQINAKDNNISNSNIDNIYRQGKYFNITNERHNNYKQLFPTLNIDNEYKKMEIWLDDNPKKRKTEKGYPRFVSGWLGRAKENEPKTNNEVPFGAVKPKVKHTVEKGFYDVQ
ncbi:MAG TPA: hypothetical protein VJ438_03190 [Candidatus Nanoarchaeia archaeon]|nr:hypothetical protein [Candidatus Nanoarchaeia archaeon]